ncbi:MAG: threonine-phosphate decarboxylase CobD [Gallionella sp.]|nr:threonine-phosphate decarboxylase CobD [Gallionella sp.]
MLEHGGRLRRAARQYGIPENDWLDLSTGINPDGWPVPAIPDEIWQRLPQDDDGLEAAAQDYYGTTKLLAVAGSQAAIQALPMLLPAAQVALVAPSYAEHAHAWRRNGHRVSTVPAAEIQRAAETAQVVVIINPNNPTGKLFGRDELLGMHTSLAARNGWLVVDEAFIDATPEHSLASLCPLPGLIVLRSLGKFFGLAGARVGFVLAEKTVLHPLAELLGPWTIAAPSRHVATLALCDTAWQDATRKALPLAAQRLAELLRTHGLISPSPPAPLPQAGEGRNSGGNSLFQWVCCADAANVHKQLAQQGILTRLYDAPHSVRFGLPRDEAQWARLAEALNRIER